MLSFSPCLVFLGSIQAITALFIFIAGDHLSRPRGRGCEVCSRRGRTDRRTQMCRAWSNITGFECRVASVDPRRLSAGRTSEARFGFSAASSVSWHQACGLQPCRSCKFQEGKLRVLLTGLEVSQHAPRWPQRSLWVLLIFGFLQGWVNYFSFASCSEILVV